MEAKKVSFQQEIKESEIGKATPETTTSPVPTELCKNVQNFFKESSEIQQQIQKLGFLCRNLSPKLSIPELSDWELFNSKLKQQGFPEVHLVENFPDHSCLLEVFSQVLKQTKRARHSEEALKEEREHLGEALQKCNLLIKRLEIKLGESRSICNQLQSRLVAIQKSDSLTKALQQPYSENEHQIFRKFMHRDYSPKHTNDAKVMAMISVFLNTPQQISSEKRVSDATETSSYASEHLQQILNSLEVDNCEDAVNLIEKMVKAIKLLPTTNKFIADLVAAMNRASLNPEQIILEVQELQLKAQEFDKFRKEAMDGIGIEDEGKILEKCRVLGYFRRLFQVGNEDDVAVIEQIFWFVHEVKQFFQQVRIKLKISESLPTNKLLQILFRQLNTY